MRPISSSRCSLRPQTGAAAGQGPRSGRRAATPTGRPAYGRRAAPAAADEFRLHQPHRGQTPGRWKSSRRWPATSPPTRNSPRDNVWLIAHIDAESGYRTTTLLRGIRCPVRRCRQWSGSLGRFPPARPGRPGDRRGRVVVQGELRQREVQVGLSPRRTGACLPCLSAGGSSTAPSAGRSGASALALLAHQRLGWVHPFIDGNGRVMRLHSHAVLERPWLHQRSVVAAAAWLRPLYELHRRPPGLDADSPRRATWMAGQSQRAGPGRVGINLCPTFASIRWGSWGGGWKIPAMERRIAACLTLKRKASVPARTPRSTATVASSLPYRRGTGARRIEDHDGPGRAHRCLGAAADRVAC